MSNGAVNIMLGSLPKNYPGANRNLARHAFYPKGLPNFTGINSNNNNNKNRTRKNNARKKNARNKITRNLRKAAANMEAEVRRQALVNQLYGPKFRPLPKVQTGAPAGAYNIFPSYPYPASNVDPENVNNNSKSIASNPGSVSVPNVPKYIKRGPRTILNPEWRNPYLAGPQNLMSGQRGKVSFVNFSRFSPRT